MRTLRTALLVLALLAAVGTAIVAQELPSPRGFVNDFAGVIPSDDEAAMRGIITAVREQTGAEIAVLTVESMAPYATIEEYGIALAEAWGVGSESDDAGAILIVALEEREVRLEVGYGLEGAIPDGRAGAILDDYVLPDLRNDEFGPGLLNGVAAVAEIIADEYGVTLTGVRAEPRRAAGRSSTLDAGDLLYLLFLLVFVGGRWFFWPLLFAGRRRGVFGGGFGSGGHSSPSRFSGFGGGGFGGGGASRGF
ncbi:MAG: TPM domain-containing protein [Spirochaetota bacterium]